jgi:hypothetical protein
MRRQYPDEPYTGLDPAGRTLDAPCRATEVVPVLVTSHDPARARTTADQVAVLSAGRVLVRRLAALGVGRLPPIGARRQRRRRARGYRSVCWPAPVGASRRGAGHASVQRDRRRAVEGPVIELRAREVVPPVIVFALVVLVLFHFTVASEPRLEAVVAPGALWVALVLGGMLGLARLIGGDVDTGCQAGLAASPADRGALFLGKWLAGLAFSALVRRSCAGLRGAAQPAAGRPHPGGRWWRWGVAGKQRGRFSAHRDGPGPGVLLPVLCCRRPAAGRRAVEATAGVWPVSPGRMAEPLVLVGRARVSGPGGVVSCHHGEHVATPSAGWRTAVWPAPWCSASPGCGA